MDKEKKIHKCPHKYVNRITQDFIGGNLKKAHQRLKMILTSKKCYALQFPHPGNGPGAHSASSQNQQGTEILHDFKNLSVTFLP